MRKDISKRIFFLILFFLGLSSVVSAAVMNDYCQTPPFIGTGGEPNILIVNDMSGSMSDSAYQQDRHGNASNYDPTKGYEGYFDPQKYYKPDNPACDPSTQSCLYHESGPPLNPCVITCSEHTCVGSRKKCGNRDKYGGGDGSWGCSGSKPFGCCTQILTSGDCNTESGNYLNWKNMRRIDLLRWALTGGRPDSCAGTSYSGDYCDPELWNESGMSGSGKVGTVCHDNLLITDPTATTIPQAYGGCILEADNGTKVKVPFERIYEGLAYQFMALPVKPRLGAISYSGSSSPYIDSHKVYLGDFLSSNNNNAAFPYLNLISHINAWNPGGYTPTGPAMWDAFNYFKMSAPQFGGFAEQNGGDVWKNPLYLCDGLAGKPGGGNCTLNACARNFVLLMSDGAWNTPDSNISSSPTCTTSTSDPESDPVVPAYCMHMGFTNTMEPNDSTDDVPNVKVNGVYTVGLFMDNTGLNAMKNVAMYGSFENSARNWPGGVNGYPANSSLDTALPSPSFSDWDRNADGVPDTFYSADDALAIKQKIMDAVQDMLTRTTSGTAASVLASGEGSGSLLVQATYYPKRKFFDDSVLWTGGLQNLWYNIDPMFTNSNIREDYGDKVLNLKADDSDDAHRDFIGKFYFDASDSKTKVRIYTDTNGDGGPDGQPVPDTVEFEQLKNLWEAGTLLWNRPASDRNIYTPIGSSKDLTASENAFSTSNLAVLRPLLNTDDAAASAGVNDQLASNIISYVRGNDIDPYAYTAGASTVTETYRSRTVQIDLNGDEDASDTNVNVGGVSMDETAAKVWKLGDIVSSTPKISSGVELNDYHLDTRAYGDRNYESYIHATAYADRGMVFVGANDGMLHAFKLGKLEQKWYGKGQYESARLTGSDLGKEMWAFIPKNALPYLKYLKDVDYCHVNFIDLTPYLVDASIKKPETYSGDYWTYENKPENWRTILIGGMKLGGACRVAGSTCSDCVKTPTDANGNPVDDSNGTPIGYSSYFALDITDQNNPKFLWEFSNEELGFSTSGPAVVRINSRTVPIVNGVSGSTSISDGNKTNGRWFVVLGSGPTGPIDSASQKFLARSDKPLTLFVLDLETGELLRTINTGITYAFAGSMLNSTLDFDVDYSDDAVYIPYVNRIGSGQNFTWTNGGVLRLLTNSHKDGILVGATGDTGLNPANWKFSKVIEGIGPVTGAVAKVYDRAPPPLYKPILRLFFGTGRYFYRSASGTDDPDNLRHLFGIVEPCFDGEKTPSPDFTDACLAGSGSLRTIGELVTIDTTTSAGADPDGPGWKIDLEPSGNYIYDEDLNGDLSNDLTRNYNAERVITDPKAQAATGVVFFATFKPYNDRCAIGGKSFMWAVRYDTGGAPAGVRGNALMQVSTGSIEQRDLSTDLNAKGGRRTSFMEGVPPTSEGLAIIGQQGASKRIIHVKER